MRRAHEAGAANAGRRSLEQAPYSFRLSCATSRPLILAFSTLDGLNTITRRGRIGTSTPVFGLRPDALALGADDERTEAGKLDGFPARGRVADFVQHRLDQFRRFGARQSDALIHDFRQIGASYGLSRFAAEPFVRHLEPQTIPPLNSARRTPPSAPRRTPIRASDFVAFRIGLSFPSRQVHRCRAYSRRE